MLANRNRSAFTLVEVLVVIAIIGLLIALVLPAVQAAREASRRASCTNNLKQLGLAAMTYESAHGCLPPCNFSGEPSHLIRLLPYLDQSPLYSSYNFSAIEEAPKANATVRNTTLAVLLCPSDSEGGPRVSTTNYAGSFGSSEKSIGGDGIFAFNSRYTFDVIRIADVTDGSSVTVFMGEWLPGRFLTNDVLERRSTFGLTQASGGDLRQQCLDLDLKSYECHGACNSKGHPWTEPCVYNHVMRPNERSCYKSNENSTAYTAGSDHPGGANVLFLDGHVQLIKNSVDLATWRRLATRNGGEVISSGDY